MKDKYKRKFIDYRYIVEDLNWIKEQILKTYTSKQDREMFIHIDKSSYGNRGYIFFSIEGSPPKGCAIYQEEHNFIIIISAWGRIKKFRDTILSKEVMEEIKNG